MRNKVIGYSVLALLVVAALNCVSSDEKDPDESAGNTSNAGDVDDSDSGLSGDGGKPYGDGGKPYGDAGKPYGDAGKSSPGEG